MNGTFIILLLVAVFLFVLWLIYRKNFKKIVVGAICLITGGVKTGKSNLSVEIARKEYKKRHRNWWIKRHIFKSNCEEPLFYTNVVFSFGNWKNKNNIVNCKRKPHKLDRNICKITKSILLRQNRIAYGSVVYIQESSLTSDNMDFNNETRNATLSLFNKLFGHSSKGGLLIYDTQSEKDNHYAIKRALGSYFYIQKKVNVLNLFHILYIREFVNSDSNEGVVNSVNEDIDFSVRKYIIWRSNFKHYDRYYFSYLTDNLPLASEPFEYQSTFECTFNEIYADLMNGLGYEQVKQRALERSQEKYVIRKNMLDNAKDKKKEELKNG